MDSQLLLRKLTPSGGIEFAWPARDRPGGRLCCWVVPCQSRRGYCSRGKRSSDKRTVGGAAFQGRANSAPIQIRAALEGRAPGVTGASGASGASRTARHGPRDCARMQV